MSAAKINWPNEDDRTVVLGSTGSGKTTFGVYLLAYRNWKYRPWVIFNFKDDRLLLRLPAKEISINSKPPSEPGLYIANILPGEDDLVSQFLFECWCKENIGLYIDEGTMMPYNDKWFRACLTQGRSRFIEMITLSQRPVKLIKEVFSEASFFAVFNLNWRKDRLAVEEYLDGNAIGRLDRYHQYWYDVAEQDMNILGPVPTGDQLVRLFEPAKPATPIGEEAAPPSRGYRAIAI